MFDGTGSGWSGAAWGELSWTDNGAMNGTQRYTLVARNTLPTQALSHIRRCLVDVVLPPTIGDGILRLEMMGYGEGELRESRLIIEKATETTTDPTQRGQHSATTSGARLHSLVVRKSDDGDVVSDMVVDIARLDAISADIRTYGAGFVRINDTANVDLTVSVQSTLV